ncbi:MAG: endonuclease/exonuclease/phosphatase family protein [Lysobacterales bacterium]
MSLFPSRLFLARAATMLLLASPAFAQKVIVNEFFRAGNLGATDEWIEVLLVQPLTAAELDGFFVGDSTGTRAAKFASYRFTNMSAIAGSFPAGTLIVVSGTTGPAEDLNYSPGSGDWNLVLKTTGANITANGSAGDFAATDVAYVDTDGTLGNATISTDGFAVTWPSPAAGAFGLVASVTIASPGNVTGAALNSDLAGATTAGNWTVGVAPASTTAGQPNGAANTTYIDGLRSAIGPVLPTLSIASLALAEGNSPACTTTAFDFTVTASEAAPVGGFNFTFNTADGTATAGSDYTAVVGGAGVIAEGQTTGTASVLVNCDPDPEASETFTVSLVDGVDFNLGSPSSATGTINNDDGIAQREIAEIQGTGFQSPFNNTDAAVTGAVVTGLVNNGFFIQDPTPDANLASSDAMFVFTSSLPTVAVGDIVDVSGTISEAPLVVTGPNYTGVTKFIDTGLVVNVTGSGSALPAPFVLDDAIPSPEPTMPYCAAVGGSFTPSDFVSTQNFECLEAMRVTTTQGVTNAPMQSFGGDPLAEINITTSGHRAFREAGMTQAASTENLNLISLTPPAPPLANVVWDGNPEVFEIDQDRLVDGAGLPVLGNPMLVPGSHFSATGVLGFEFGGYELFPDTIDVFAPAPPIPGTVPAAATADQLRIGSLNMLRFFDRCDDPVRPNADEVVDLPRVVTKLDKLSRYVREVLGSPDLIAAQEAEQASTPDTVCANGEPNVSALQLLADKIVTDGGPIYTPVIAPFTNDLGWINVGFLVRADRVQVNATQHLIAEDTWVFNGITQSRLNDRPSFLLEATALFTTPPLDFTVIDNHLRSLSGIDDLSPVADQVNAHRVRQKKLRQAVGLACEAQAYQTANPERPLILVGDFNAFQFSDGYADTLGIVRGDADPAASEYGIEFIPPAERCDNPFNGQIVSPALAEAVFSLPEDERYSFYFQGVPQELDHALLSDAATQRFEGIAYGRGNSDARLNEETVPGTALRSSDHDGFVVYLNAGSAPTNNGFVLFADGME